MKVWVLYEGYWDDPDDYIMGVTTDKNTAIHWQKTKPKEMASRTVHEFETIDNVLVLDNTINKEERRKYYEVNKHA